MTPEFPFALDYNDAEDGEVYRAAEWGLLTLTACTASGAPDRLNEDSFAVVGDGRRVTVGVFDGVTSLRPIPALAAQGITGARYASHFLRRHFAARAARLDPAHALLALNAVLLESAHQLGADLGDTHTLPASTATIARVDLEERRIEVANVGDSFLIAVQRNGDTTLVTRNDNERYDRQMRELMLSIAASRGITPRMAMQAPEMKQALVEMYDYRNNRPDGAGCGVLNGDPRVAPYIHVAELPLAGVGALLIATDGFVPPGLSIEAAEDRVRLCDAVESAGLAGVIRWKRAVEDADPDWQLARYKHSDDATGVYLKFASTI